MITKLCVNICKGCAIRVRCQVWVNITVKATNCDPAYATIQCVHIQIAHSLCFLTASICCTILAQMSIFLFLRNAILSEPCYILWLRSSNNNQQPNYKNLPRPRVQFLTMDDNETSGYGHTKLLQEL